MAFWVLACTLHAHLLGAAGAFALDCARLGISAAWSSDLRGRKARECPFPGPTPVPFIYYRGNNSGARRVVSPLFLRCRCRPARRSLVALGAPCPVCPPATPEDGREPFGGPFGFTLPDDPSFDLDNFAPGNQIV